MSEATDERSNGWVKQRAKEVWIEGKGFWPGSLPFCVLRAAWCKESGVQNKASRILPAVSMVPSLPSCSAVPAVPARPERRTSRLHAWSPRKDFPEKNSPRDLSGNRTMWPTVRRILLCGGTAIEQWIDSNSRRKRHGASIVRRYMNSHNPMAETTCATMVRRKLGEAHRLGLSCLCNWNPRRRLLLGQNRPYYRRRRKSAVQVSRLCTSMHRMTGQSENKTMRNSGNDKLAVGSIG